MQQFLIRFQTLCLLGALIATPQVYAGNAEDDSHIDHINASSQEDDIVVEEINFSPEDHEAVIAKDLPPETPTSNSRMKTGSSNEKALDIRQIEEKHALLRRHQSELRNLEIRQIREKSTLD